MPSAAETRLTRDVTSRVAFGVGVGVGVRGRSRGRIRGRLRLRLRGEGVVRERLGVIMVADHGSRLDVRL